MRAIGFCDCTRQRTINRGSAVGFEAPSLAPIVCWNRQFHVFGGDIGVTIARSKFLSGLGSMPSCSIALNRNCRMVSTSTGWSMSRLARHGRGFCRLLVVLSLASALLHAQD